MPARFPPARYVPAPSGNLIEIFDPAGRVVCLLEENAVSAELPVHKVVVLAQAAKNIFLLRQCSENRFDVTACGQLTAASSLEEYAGRILARDVGQTAPLRCAAMWRKMGARGFLSVFGANFSTAMLRAMAASQFMLADAAELRFLGRQNMLEPLLVEVLPLFAPEILAGD